MAQHNDEHLTIAQLSAYADRELAPDELALCEAHVQTCQPCQAALADLRLTSALLSGIPQVEVPRSFALPINIIALPGTPAHARLPEQRGRAWKRSLRALSAVAAVLGLLFILAGAFSALPHASNMAATSSVVAPNTQSSGSQVEAPRLTATASSLTPRAASTKQAASGTSVSAPTATPVPTPPPTSTQPVFNSVRQPQQPAAPPAALDPGQPEGRLSIGGVLFVLGVLGIVLTRRSRRERQVRE